MSLEVKLEVFEGPLDLLLHLIDKNKVNIYDIPIVIITEQYLDYVAGMEREDLNVVSEFIVMAAMLLDIKAKMLLPAEEEEEEEEDDPRQELVEKLLEYKMYKCMSMELKDRQLDAERAMYREQNLPEEVAEYEQPVDLEQLVDGLTLIRLKQIFDDVLKRSENKIDPIRSKFGKIQKEDVNLEERTAYVHDYVRSHRQFSFRQLLGSSHSKMEVIVTFLVILEMIKGGKVNVLQENRQDDILITSKEADEDEQKH